METQTILAPVQRTVVVPLGLNHSFRRFTRGIGLWWPAEFTWAGKNLEELGIEPRLGGMAWECGRHGFSCTWGQVLAWEPPERLVLAWEYGADPDSAFDPACASEVEAHFRPLSEWSTEVTVDHRAFERLGPGAARFRTMMDAPGGWSTMLRRYARVDGY